MSRLAPLPVGEGLEEGEQGRRPSVNVSAELTPQPLPAGEGHSAPTIPIWDQISTTIFPKCLFAA